MPAADWHLAGRCAWKSWKACCREPRRKMCHSGRRVVPCSSSNAARESDKREIVDEISHKVAGLVNAGGSATSGRFAALSRPSIASATIPSVAADWDVSAAASARALIPVWSHPLSARPRPTDAGTTTSRAVRLRKLSMRCRTSCSFMAGRQCTTFSEARQTGCQCLSVDARLGGALLHPAAA